MLAAERLPTAGRTALRNRSHTTVADIVQAVVSMCAGYDWRLEDGVVHIFQRDLVDDSRNPLNITIMSFGEQAETVPWADALLFNTVWLVARMPGAFGLPVSILHKWQRSD